MADVGAFAVDPLEAIELTRQRLDLPTRTWTDLWEGMHARAFVVAGAQGDALLADFHQAVNRNIAEGQTIEQFRADFDRIIEEHGWSYRGSRNWRSRVIFQTNLRTAYAAGRWAQVQRVKQARPYMRYVAVMDGRTRPEHAAWHNTVLHADHPFWHTHYPPNGWNCRCTVQSLGERDLARYGLALSEEAPSIEMIERTINTPEGARTVRVPEGIDPGFAYNVGIAGFGRGTESLALERHGTWRALQAPGEPRTLPPLPLDQATAPPIAGVAPDNEAGLRAALRQALGGDELIVADPRGGRVRLTQAIVDHMVDPEHPERRDGRERYFGLLPDLVRDPAEIWIGWAQSDASGRVAMRRRYIRLVDLGGGRTIGLIADADGGEWSGVTFFRGSRTGARLLRSGLLLYRR